MLCHWVLVFMLCPLCLCTNFQFTIRQIRWCNKLHYRFPPGDKVALASFPGSGNTWLRYLLQQATGILTGAVYMDRRLRLGGFPAESVTNGSVLVIKTHENPDEPFKSAVLLIRNPRDAILSYFNFVIAGHSSQAPKRAFRDSFNSTEKKQGRWPEFVERRLKEYASFHSMWLQSFRGPLHIVFYEDLVRDTRHTLQGILDFLRHNYTEIDVYCAISRREGVFRRVKDYVFDPYTPEMIINIDRVKKKVYEMVEEYNRTHNRAEATNEINARTF